MHWIWNFKTASLWISNGFTGDSKHPPQRVVAIEDLWDTLVGVHNQLSHGGRQRMERYLIEHGTHVPRPVIQLFLISARPARRQEGEEHAQDYTQAKGSQNNF